MKNKCEMKLAARALVIGVVAALMLAGTAMGEVSRAGLVGEWHFEGDAKDSSGNGNDGTIYGASFVEGKFGKALSFHGANNYVEVPNSASLNIINAMTISAWIKWNGGNACHHFVSKFKDSNKNGYLLEICDVRSSFYFANGGVLYDASATSQTSTGTWHYIVGTFDGTTMSLFVDGVSAATKSRGIVNVH